MCGCDFQLYTSISDDERLKAHVHLKRDTVLHKIIFQHKLRVNDLFESCRIQEGEAQYTIRYYVFATKAINGVFDRIDFDTNRCTCVNITLYDVENNMHLSMIYTFRNVPCLTIDGRRRYVHFEYLDKTTVDCGDEIHTSRLGLKAYYASLINQTVMHLSNRNGEVLRHISSPDLDIDFYRKQFVIETDILYTFRLSTVFRYICTYHDVMKDKLKQYCHCGADFRDSNKCRCISVYNKAVDIIEGIDARSVGRIRE